MTCVFEPGNDFSLAANGARLEQNYRQLRESFPDGTVEFFYYIKPCEAETFFIMRINTPNAEDFAEAVEMFRENMRFPVLNSARKKAFFARTMPLNDYV